MSSPPKGCSADNLPWKKDYLHCFLVYHSRLQRTVTSTKWLQWTLARRSAWRSSTTWAPAMLRTCCDFSLNTERMCSLRHCPLECCSLQKKKYTWTTPTDRTMIWDAILKQVMQTHSMISTIFAPISGKSLKQILVGVFLKCFWRARYQNGVFSCVSICCYRPFFRLMSTISWCFYWKYIPGFSCKDTVAWAGNFNVKLLYSNWSAS